MGKATNKVNAGDNATATKDDKKKGRVDFPKKDALYTDDKGNNVSAVNADGLLIAVPKPIKDSDKKVVYAGFNTRKHKPLKKTDFANIATFIRYQAFVCQVKAAILLKLAEEKNKKADNIEKYGDESTRKKVAKLDRLRKTLAALEAGLKDDGVDISEIPSADSDS